MPGTQKQHRREGEEEEEEQGKKRSEPRTRLTRALAPYSRDRAAVGDAEGSPGLGPGEARRAGELQRPGHFLYSRCADAGIAPALRTIVSHPHGERGAGPAGEGGRRDPPFLLSRALRRSGVPPGLGMLLPLLRRHARLLLPRAGTRPGRSPGGVQVSTAGASRGLRLLGHRAPRRPLSPRPPCRCCPQEAAGYRHTRTRPWRSRAPGGREVAGALAARGSPTPGEEAAGGSGPGGRAGLGKVGQGWREGPDRPLAPFSTLAPLLPTRAVSKRGASPGRWMPLVANRSPTLRAQPGDRGRRPQHLPGVRCPSRWKTPPDRWAVFDPGENLESPITAKVRIPALIYLPLKTAANFQKLIRYLIRNPGSSFSV
ncbi:uncharacterized protein LOC129536037 [Moschus berezovskii]|uniref:uncharacterized protein LOC129536037 n=1 Tax=Moschus berezovskii TaxID=68408 RepID=UPI002444D521|nr:uncharacterized protein LOC129536037 [Moschus berezovskii]